MPSVDHYHSLSPGCTPGSPGHSQQEGPHWFGSQAPQRCSPGRELFRGGVGEVVLFPGRPAASSRLRLLRARGHRHLGPSTQGVDSAQLLWPKHTDQVRQQGACSWPSPWLLEMERQRAHWASALVGANRASQVGKAFLSLSWEEGRRSIGCRCGKLPSTPQEPSIFCLEASKGSAASQFDPDHAPPRGPASGVHLTPLQPSALQLHHRPKCQVHCDPGLSHS